MNSVSDSLIERSIYAQVEERRKKQEGSYGLVEGSFEALEPNREAKSINS